MSGSSAGHSRATSQHSHLACIQTDFLLPGWRTAWRANLTPGPDSTGQDAPSPPDTFYLQVKLKLLPGNLRVIISHMICPTVPAVIHT